MNEALQQTDRTTKAPDVLATTVPNILSKPEPEIVMEDAEAAINDPESLIVPVSLTSVKTEGQGRAVTSYVSIRKPSDDKALHGFTFAAVLRSDCCLIY